MWCEMAFKQIVKIWNNLNIKKTNIDFLTTKTLSVQFPLSKYDKKIIKDLKDTADRIDCAGIASNQIGHTKRIFIAYKDNALEEYKIYINPEIIEKFEDSIVGAYYNKLDHLNRHKPNLHIYEGCLSLPKAEFSFPRFHKIKVKYFNKSGIEEIEVLEKFHSQIFQHELDHLDGRTIAHRFLESLVNKTGGTMIPAEIEKYSEDDIINNFKKLESKFKLLENYLNK